MAKKGLLFERVVADITQSFDATVNVVQGKWTVGPDGRRDRDVSFTGMSAGKPYKTLIECKDFNPKTSGRVGIGYVDALDSKRHDLGVDIAIICSNAGFAKPAIAKARRVGIGLIGAMRMGDDRLRFQIYDTVYTRKLTILPQDITVTVEQRAGDTPCAQENVGNLETWGFQGLLVRNWVIKRITQTLIANPIVNGFLVLEYRFRAPITLEVTGRSVQAIRLAIQAKVTGAWYKHNAHIDASAGFYDWVRRRARIAPGSKRVLVKYFDVLRGKKIQQPPSHVLSPLPFMPTELDVGAIKTYAPLPSGPAPALEQYIEPEDLQLAVRGLEPAAYTSTPGFVPDS